MIDSPECSTTLEIRHGGLMERHDARAIFLSVLVLAFAEIYTLSECSRRKLEVKVEERIFKVRIDPWAREETIETWRNSDNQLRSIRIFHPKADRASALINANKEPTIRATDAPLSRSRLIEH